jgi:hypothetical protein
MVLYKISNTIKTSLKKAQAILLALLLALACARCGKMPEQSNPTLRKSRLLRLDVSLFWGIIYADALFDRRHSR